MSALPYILTFALSTSTVAPEERVELPTNPGGYWDPGEHREKAPDNGEQKILIGAIIAPLGILRTAAGVATYVVSVPSRCQQVWGRNASDETCKGLRIYGIAGIALGGLMAGTGIFYLSWGLINRKKYRAWEKKHNFSWSPFWEPEISPSGLSKNYNLGLQIQFRF